MTKEEIRQMDEDSLRRVVLLPLFGQKISLGPVKFGYFGLSIPPDEQQQIRQGIADKSDRIPFELKFRDGTPSRAIFPNWDPQRKNTLS